MALAVASLLAFAVRDVAPPVAERASLRSEGVAGLRFGTVVISALRVLAAGIALLGPLPFRC
ncbi:hypothetical protein [Saccharopolyspora sp. NPDC049357]|uniref:hypothetical protein n=1 Tax=Saccharopolyspora sp. NPDC049357 TaxID=3154507 RepID=UPI003437D793